MKSKICRLMRRGLCEVCFVVNHNQRLRYFSAGKLFIFIWEGLSFSENQVYWNTWHIHLYWAHFLFLSRGLHIISHIWEPLREYIPHTPFFSRNHSLSSLSSTYIPRTEANILVCTISRCLKNFICCTFSLIQPWSCQFNQAQILNIDVWQVNLTLKQSFPIIALTPHKTELYLLGSRLRAST